MEAKVLKSCYSRLASKVMDAKANVWVIMNISFYPQILPEANGGHDTFPAYFTEITLQKKHPYLASLLHPPSPSVQVQTHPISSEGIETTKQRMAGVWPHEEGPCESGAPLGISLAVQTPAVLSVTLRKR